jgi:hypothetical protein
MVFVVDHHFLHFAHENLGGTTPFAKPNTTDFLQVDQKQHLQLMDTSLQLFYLLWTRQLIFLLVSVVKWVHEHCTCGWFAMDGMNLCEICRKNKTASGYVRFIIGVIGDCPETSVIG